MRIVVVVPLSDQFNESMRVQTSEIGTEGFRSASKSLANRLTAVGHLEINSYLINSFIPLSWVCYTNFRRRPRKGLICPRPFACV